MTNKYDENEDLSFYEKYFDIESTSDDKETLSCEGMLEVDPDIWVEITCLMKIMRQTEMAYHSTITVNQVDSSGLSNELFGGSKVSWIPKSQIESSHWICKNVFEHPLKVSNRRF